jgi:hypothetical protein
MASRRARRCGLVGSFTPIPFVLTVNTNGAPWRVSAIQVSTGGTVYAKPINRN